MPSATTREFLPSGQTGEVMLRGPSVMPGYLLGDIDGIPCGLEDGWLPTGDMGTVDGSGFLRIVGRTKEIINRGGEKISPYDVEKALLGHPAVREAAAFAVPHPRLGENVGAAVVLHRDGQATSPQLIDFIYDRLAPFQMPRHIHILERLPVGATGKISRRELSAAFADHRRTTERPAASLEILIADIWQRLLPAYGHRHGRRFLRDRRRFAAGHRDAARARGDDAPPHRPVGRARAAHDRQLCGTLASAAAEKRELLTRVKPGQGTPLFVCHGDFCGWGFYAFRLAELLKGDGPVYLLHSLLDSTRETETIEDMVGRYLPHIEAAVPNGPIRLAGYCHGGLAALEVARRLEGAGRTVDKIVLIDTFSINARPLMRAIVPVVSFASRFVPGAWGRRLRRSGLPSLWRLVTHVLARDHAIARRVGRTIRTGKMEFTDTSRRTTYYRAMSKYVPRKIHAEVICLLSEEYAGRRNTPSSRGSIWRPGCGRTAFPANTIPASAAMSASSPRASTA